MDYNGTDQNDVLDQSKLGIPAGSNIFGGKGNDTITISSGNAVGEAGDDTIIALNNYAGAAYWNSPAAIKVNLATGKAQDGFGGTDTLVNVRTVHDSNFDDEITGSSANETFWLSGGNNKVVGGGGSDTVNFYNVKSTDYTVSYNAASDTFTLKGASTTHTLTGVASIQFIGPNSDSVTVTRDMFAETGGFLRQRTTLPSFDMGWIAQMRAGDFNGDGKGDILVVRIHPDLGLTPQPLQILIGDGNGGFTDKTASLFKDGIPKVNYVPRIFAADFNKDGLTDIFNPDFGYDAPPFPGGQNSLYVSNKATGLLENRTSTLPQANLQNHGTSIGDINRDGYPDILVNALNEFTGNANQLLVNDGKGNFTVMQQLLPASLRQTGYDPGYTWSMLRDLNGDGADDIVLGTWDNSALPSSVVLNDGKGNFANATLIDLPRSGVDKDIVIGIETIDLNGDALPDMVLSVTNGGNTSTFYRVPYLQLLVNQGNGQFKDETDIRLPQSKTPDPNNGSMNWYLSATPVDVNNDGFQDIVVDGAGATSRVYMNDGTGKFKLGWEGSSNYAHILAMDVNGDGKPDLVEAGQAGFSILLNTGPNRIGASGVYKAGDGGEKISGGTAAERVFSGKGNDTIDGGGGTDTVVYDGGRASYSVIVIGTSLIVSDGGMADGTDTLSNIERLAFSDGNLAFDTSGVAGQAYRIYQAAFNRTPDLPGLGFWIKMMDLGTPLKGVADAFVVSSEFKSIYGTAPSNLEIVNRLYSNVLHRPGEADGVKFWTSVLDQKLATVAEVLAAFSESPENQAALVGVMANGIAYTPFG